MTLDAAVARRVLRWMAWLCLAYIAVITVGPLGVRPITGWSPQLERLIAFAIVGALFGAAYPRHILLAALVVIGAAVLLELSQLLSPSRHGRIFDAGVKITGGMIGIAVGWLVSRLVMRR